MSGSPLVAWLTFDVSYALDAMPSDVLTAYNAWLLAHPDKETRLSVLMYQVLADFRTALAANPNVEMDEDTTKLASRCVPHAFTIVLYYLLLEMGSSINYSAQTAFNNAQVYLRRLFYADEAVDGSTASQTPTYDLAAERPARLTTGV